MAHQVLFLRNIHFHAFFWALWRKTIILLWVTSTSLTRGTWCTKWNGAEPRICLHHLLREYSCSSLIAFSSSFVFFIICYFVGGKGEGAAGIFEAWDINYDGKVTVEEVWLSSWLSFSRASASIWNRIFFVGGLVRCAWNLARLFFFSQK